ncbi:MAG: Sec-independent protein translocase subunit TatA/TatB [Anaerolineales bacterium]
MEILGIGPLEFFFILLIALIVLGPSDMVKTGRMIGRFLNKLVRSPTWKTIQKATQEIKQLPTTLMREANLEEAIKDIPSPQDILKDANIEEVSNSLKQTNQDIADWLTPPQIILPTPGDEGNNNTGSSTEKTAEGNTNSSSD